MKSTVPPASGTGRACALNARPEAISSDPASGLARRAKTIAPAANSAQPTAACRARTGPEPFARLSSGRRWASASTIAVRVAHARAELAAMSRRMRLILTLLTRRRQQVQGSP